jgi:hypothetical protein
LPKGEILLPGPGESAHAPQQRLAEYEAAYKAASLKAYTGGFRIAVVICLVALVFAFWLRRDPASDVGETAIF